jgi:hypothetical protein
MLLPNESQVIILLNKRLFMNIKYTFFLLLSIFLFQSGAGADPVPLDQILNGLKSSQINTDLMLKLIELQGILNNENVDSQVEQVKGIANGKYPNGKPVVTGWTNDHLLYPNGQAVTGFGGGLLYPNGQAVNRFGEELFYPNGRVIKDSSGIHDRNGNIIASMPMIEWPHKEVRPPAAASGGWGSAKGGSKWAIETPKEKSVGPEITPSSWSNASGSGVSTASSLTESQIKELKTWLIDRINEFVWKEVVPSKKSFSATEIKDRIRPEFFRKVRSDYSVSELKAAEYFGKLWSDTDIQGLVQTLKW